MSQEEQETTDWNHLYPIKPHHINTYAVVEGHIADFTVDGLVLAAIINCCALTAPRGEWRSVSIEEVKAEIERLSPEAAVHDFDECWDSIYRDFYVVENDRVTLTHDCIAHLFKKFPVQYLGVEHHMGALA